LIATFPKIEETFLDKPLGTYVKNENGKRLIGIIYIN